MTDQSHCTLEAKKVAWSVFEGGRAGRTVLIPAAIGLLICDAAVYLGVEYVKRRA